MINNSGLKQAIGYFKLVTDAIVHTYTCIDVHALRKHHNLLINAHHITSVRQLENMIEHLL